MATFDQCQREYDNRTPDECEHECSDTLCEHNCEEICTAKKCIREPYVEPEEDYEDEW